MSAPSYSPVWPNPSVGPLIAPNESKIIIIIIEKKGTRVRIEGQNAFHRHPYLFGS